MRSGSPARSTWSPMPPLPLTVMRGLFQRELGLQHIGFALAETLAHLNAHRAKGAVARETASDGVWRYRRL